MMRINKFLFYEICGKDMDMYDKICLEKMCQYRNWTYFRGERVGEDALVSFINEDSHCELKSCG